MSQLTVRFLPYDRSVLVQEGESLIRAAMAAGVHVNASCGGEGVCGKCRVLIEEGRVIGGISERLTHADVEKGYRLACLSSLTGDTTVRIPVESSIDTTALARQYTPRRTAKIKVTDINNLKEQGLFIAPVVKSYLELAPPTAQDNLPDVSRLIRALKQEGDWHRLELTLPVIRSLPAILRENNFKVTATLVKAVRKTGKTRIINVQAGDTTAANFAVAMDIGTTTIFGQLIHLESGECLSELGDFNGQISYGEDVISRIMFAEKPGGLEKLQEVVIASINKILGKMISQAKVDRENISTITLAGNTTMTQLLLGIDPRYIRRAPYVPASTHYPPFSATSIGIDLDEHATALLFPEISSYVGGDIVAGVMGSGMYRSEELVLFMDIGTNAEIVIGNKDWLACTACSAGPAFEGGGVEFGMRAAKGAIEDFSLIPRRLSL